MRWLGALLLLLVLNTGLKVLAWQESPIPAPAPRFVQVGEVQITELTPAEGTGLVDGVGRLHLAIVHFPLAWLVGLVLVDLVGLILKRAPWIACGLPILSATVLGLLAAAGTGLLRASAMFMDASEHAVMVRHRTLNFVVTGLCLVAMGLRWRTRNHPLGRWRTIYLVLIFTASVLVLVSGGLGGRLAHGPGSLPF